MNRRFFFLLPALCIAALMSIVTVSYAQTAPAATAPTTPGVTDSSAGGGTPFSDYAFTNPNAFGAVGEGINLQPLEQIQPLTPNTGTGDTETANLQGCGGVGQAEYTTSVFNMPEVFNKFKRDVNTDLAKQLLTYNYSLPQTAALFETLNTYGNQRYQQFLQGCSLDDLKKDARKQYLDACIKNLPEATATTGASANLTLTDGEKYARAWEICTAMYAAQGQTDTAALNQALTKRTDTNKKFAELIRSTENVNKYLTPLLCPAESSASTAQGQQGGATNPPANNANATCWGMLFLPQVSLCNGKDLQGGCTGENKYGVKPAPLPMRTFFDALRTILNQELITKVVNDLDSQIRKSGINNSTQIYAATQAVNA
ncbi:MAG: hypothetical protein EBR79_03680, partial [Proteobacteria bacterium]|nr:hypothetical protein [Pseudomonadota bacterium]